jgi:DNA-binding HxlR family transcriptional regulator
MMATASAKGLLIKSFGQFCPLAQASQLLCERWTLLVVRELVAGSTRFSELTEAGLELAPQRKS